MIYATYGRWEHVTPLSPAEVERVSTAFRPRDDGVCVWTEPDEPSVLRVSIDVDAGSYDEALQLARGALVEAASAASLSGAASELVATTEEGQAVWMSP